MLAVNRIPARRDKMGYQHHARHYSLLPRKKEYSTAKTNKKKNTKKCQTKQPSRSHVPEKGGGML